MLSILCQTKGNNGCFRCMLSVHSVQIYLRKLSALGVETLPPALATCGETAGRELGQRL